MFFRLTCDRRIELDRVLARRSDDDLLHVAVGSVQQPALFRGRKHRDRARRTGRAQVRAFQRIDRDIDMRNFLPVGESSSDLLADIEHRRLVALALADDDGSVHGNRVHGFAHGLGRHLVAQLSVALPHGARRFDGRVLYHAQEFERQIALYVLSETFCMRFVTG